MLDIYFIGILLGVLCGLVYARKITNDHVSINDCVGYGIACVFWPIILGGVILIFVTAFLAEAFERWLNKGK